MAKPRGFVNCRRATGAEEHKRWYETHGKKIEAEVAADPSNRRVHPSESFKQGSGDYKTNGEGLIFKYDRGGGERHNAEIEVWNHKSGKHLGTINPLTGEPLRGPQPGKHRRKHSSLPQTFDHA